MANLSCRICETRRARRFCPGVRGDICSICCGTEREMTVDCPLDCEYLRDARRREKPPDINPEEFPNKDIRISQPFLRENEKLLLFAARTLVRAALETPGAVDYDMREALDSLVRTYRTLETGLIYETRPATPLAAHIHQAICDGLVQFREQMAREMGMRTIRDAEILGILAFLQRLEIQHNNGRKRGRAFIDFLNGYFGQAAAGPEGAGRVGTPPSSLIVP